MYVSTGIANYNICIELRVRPTQEGIDTQIQDLINMATVNDIMGLVPKTMITI